MKKTSHSGLELWTFEYEASVLSLDHQSSYQRLPHINISSIQNSFLLVTFTGLTALWDIYLSGFGSLMSKYLQLLQGFWVRILGVNFKIFSCWHPWETRFKSGFHSSFWDLICGIWKWGSASSFWNHVIQISIRQVHFQDKYSQLWILKIFTENIYFL